jgi:hypothetical protein
LPYHKISDENLKRIWDFISKGYESMQTMQNIRTKKNVNQTTTKNAPFGAGITSQTKLTLTRVFMLASIFGLAWLITAL